MIYNLELKSPVISRFDGETLIDSLERRFTYQKRDFWQKCIESKKISVDGMAVSPLYKLQTGQTVIFSIDDFYEPDLDTGYKIIWQNDELLLANKPALLPVHSTRRIFYQTLTGILRRDTGISTLNPLHRLDRETSGLILYQKQPFKQRRLRKKPSSAIARKMYIAVVEGNFNYDFISVNKPLSETKCPPVFYKMQASDNGKPALTNLYKLASVGGKSLLLAEIKTGRKHQIRTHLEYLGFPIVGDKLYSHGSLYFLKRCNDCLTKADIEQIGSEHQLLHAWHIALSLHGMPFQSFFSEYLSASWQKHLLRFTNWQKLLYSRFEQITGEKYLG